MAAQSQDLCPSRQGSAFRQRAWTNSEFPGTFQEPNSQIGAVFPPPCHNGPRRITLRSLSGFMDAPVAVLAGLGLVGGSLGLPPVPTSRWWMTRSPLAPVARPAASMTRSKRSHRRVQALRPHLRALQPDR